MKRVTMIVGLTLCALFSATVVFVQPAAAQSDLYLFGGVQDPGKITLTNIISMGGNGGSQILNDPSNVGVFGARFSHGKMWGGEYTIAFAPHFLDSRSRAIVYNSDIKIAAPLPGFQPYVVFGPGAITSWDHGASNIGTRLALNYGGGVRFVAGGPFGLQLDVRGYTVPSVQSQTLNLTEVTMGIVIRFGERPQKSSSAPRGNRNQNLQ
ncbi:MAG TPA: outer membrane beta-barrel protein [Terriglobia bacterium]|nr:outer membrane beta-barrel protein [Terriglobia bacterium]